MGFRAGAAAGDGAGPAGPAAGPLALRRANWLAVGPGRYYPFSSDAARRMAMAVLRLRHGGARRAHADPLRPVPPHDRRDGSWGVSARRRTEPRRTEGVPQGVHVPHEESRREGVHALPR